MAEHELNDADVDAVSEQPAGAFMSQVMPAQIDPVEVLTVPAMPSRLGLGSCP